MIFPYLGKFLFRSRYSGISSQDIGMVMFTMLLEDTCATILCCDGPLSSQNSQRTSIWPRKASCGATCCSKAYEQSHFRDLTLFGVLPVGRLLNLLSPCSIHTLRSLHRMPFAGQMLVLCEFCELSGPLQHRIVAHVSPKSIADITMQLS